MPRASWDFIGNISLPTLPLESQKLIARFLDRKTATIDTLIAKKQRLIQLLEEKRTALINQAVTKGLNPNAPMKDSGIPWIGEIPEHWEVKKLKWLCPYIMVGIVVTPAKYYVEFGIPCLRSLNIKPGKIIEENLVYISEESNEILSKSKIFVGDLVCVRTGQPGTTAVVDERFNGINCIDLIIIRKSVRASSDYISLMMNSEVCRSQYSMGTSGSIQQHFNVETATNLIICNPPLDEQLRIVERCQKIIEKHQILIQKVSDQIEKLQEYRRSLITAAVTGKLEISEAEADV
jgi:type I restriction enzyme S subunit